MTHNNKLFDFFLDFIRNELNKPEFKATFVKPMLIYFLYYIIPFIIIFILLNFITTIIAVFLVFHIKLK